MADKTDNAGADTGPAKDAIVKEALEVFDLCEERERDNRADALDDLEFARLAKQWDDRDVQARKRDGRPFLTVNKLPAYIRQVVNDVRQNTPSIIVHPVDSNADVRTAEVINGLIRNIETTSDADVAYDTAADFAVSSGFGAFRINLAYSDDDTFDKDIQIKRIANPFSVYGDPHSFAADSADWNVAFVTNRMTKKAFEKKYKGAAPVDWESDPYDSLAAPWLCDDEVQVAEYWKREEVARTVLLLSDGTVINADEYQANQEYFQAIGLAVIADRPVRSHKVTQYVLNGVETLETVDWVGRFIPVVPVYGDDVIVNERRYLRSLIRDAKDPQRMFNYWRTTATELVALAPKAPFIGPKGAFDFDPNWATANTQSHAYLEYEGNVAPQRQAFAGVPAGALQEALNCSDDMKAIMGLYDASLGAQSNETSGRAIMARQREGDVSNFHFSDNLSRAIRHAGRIVLDLIPKVYTTERMVRILGVDGKPQSVPINQPVILQDGQPPQPAPQPTAPGMAPQVPNGALLHVFDLTVGKYDLTVETGPSFTTQREEAANQMIELLRAFPQAAPVIGDLLAKNLDWPGAEEISQRLQALQQHQFGGTPGQPGAQPGQPGQMPPEAMAIIQKLQAQVAALAQQNTALQADHSVDVANAQTKQFEAQTKRMQAITAASRPSHIPQ